MIPAGVHQGKFIQGNAILRLDFPHKAHGAAALHRRRINAAEGLAPGGHGRCHRKPWRTEGIFTCLDQHSGSVFLRHAIQHIPEALLIIGVQVTDVSIQIRGHFQFAVKGRRNRL